MVIPERRRRVDIVVSLAIVVVLAAAGALVWEFSPARHTDSEPATWAPPAVRAPELAPESFSPRWTAPSTASTLPQIGAATVLTGADGTLVGRNPVTGDPLWSYHRDLRLCSMLAWNGGETDLAVGAYATARGCGEITELDAATGRRTGTRSSLADADVTLSTDGGYAMSQGPTRLETWGTNLVRGIEYGRVDAPVKPGVQPHEGQFCLIHSAVVSGSRVAVIERCDDEPGYRLTVLSAVLDKDDKVTQYGSSIITSGTAAPAPVVIAMSSTGIAVYDGGGNSVEPSGATIRQFDSNGAQLGASSVRGPAGPPPDSRPVTRGGLTTYWTGSGTVALDALTMRPLFQLDATTGPGVVMGGQLLVPTRTGIGVRNAADGTLVRSIPLQRNEYRGQLISSGVLGGMLYEQWGGVLHAYGPAR